jgi:hypothetical protein
LRGAFEQGLAQRHIGAEYIAHALGLRLPQATGRRQQELPL